MANNGMRFKFQMSAEAMPREMLVAILKSAAQHIEESDGKYYSLGEFSTDGNALYSLEAKQDNE